MTFLVALGVVWLLVAGLVGVATSRNVIHLIGCLTVAKSSTAVLFATIGYRHEASAPIRDPAAAKSAVVDPVVQAILLVDIVVGATVTALLLALAIQFKRRTGSLDPREFLPSAWRHHPPAGAKGDGEDRRAGST